MFFTAALITLTSSGAAALIAYKKSKLSVLPAIDPLSDERYQNVFPETHAILEAFANYKKLRHQHSLKKERIKRLNKIIKLQESVLKAMARPSAPEFQLWRAYDAIWKLGPLHAFAAASWQRDNAQKRYQQAKRIQKGNISTQMIEQMNLLLDLCASTTYEQCISSEWDYNIPNYANWEKVFNEMINTAVKAS